MSKPPIMPKATAVWLIDNTKLTFQQIAEFCHMHPLEIKNIADGEIEQNIIGQDPINAGQIIKYELENAENDPNHTIRLAEPKFEQGKNKKTRKKSKYTPLIVRRNRPDAIAWIVKNHPEIPDRFIVKLIGTTKNTIGAIREKTHWNISSINPVDPVALGFCSQIEIDEAIKKALISNAKDKQKQNKAKKIRQKNNAEN